MPFRILQRPRGLQAQLPYKTHPIYQLRRASIYVAIIGGILTLLASTSDYYDLNEQPIYGYALFLLFISFLFCLHDLATYAIAKITQAPLQPSLLPSTRTEARHSDNGDDDDNPKPKWPRKRSVITDGVLAVLLQVMFWFFMASRSYRSTATGAYAGLAILVASILHGMAFWRGLMARKHAQWRAELQAKPCARCGFFDSEHGDEGRAQTSGECLRQDLQGVQIPGDWRVGAMAEQNRNAVDVDVEARKDAERDLLLTPEGSTSSRSQGYGMLKRTAEPMPSVQEKTVKKKGKKRVVVDGSDAE
ncbi:uncharacterized protein BDZ99DRAFT_528508 [Mytilinidion resinicola]|uniref:Uncharacterized protein n=1 Tax=Mytilinidion resinicola TaxID=574789 RepID=A0A6A6XYP6_9PEZI|nr:uncharacterized protein BDZ99DRAFT_528508 [Mytilinidion resinicola]KAF2801398.1 hypothetical protein BDZ99DRAFT_528508 [Mytilinidion resinicola]